ncbi:MAG: D-glycero-beta-D-manno-heptose 1,7-bisphosphate 7-phosphatase [Woeseia sp.]
MSQQDTRRTRLVVLDRDGVINRDSTEFVKSPKEWIPLEGSLDAIASLTRSGFTVAVASNQSGVGRGLLDRRALHAIHRKMRRCVKQAGGLIDRIVYCPHLPNVGCHCRKPAPGLLERLGRLYQLSLRGVPVVGDSLRDVEAARAVGARPILVLTGNGAATREKICSRHCNIETYENLLAAAEALVSGQAGCGRDEA